MAAVTEADSSLASKCMAFCQALASQGQAFSFSLSIGQDFSFSLDSRSKATKYPETKKKASPSTLRRNAKRREEFKKKQGSPAQNDENAVNDFVVPACDLCEYKAASEKGLRQHVRMKHQKPSPQFALATPESLRGQGESTRSLTSSPLLHHSREENCHNCEGPFSPGHQCGAVIEEAACCTCTNLDCCGCKHEFSCLCYKRNKQTNFCDCKGVPEGSTLQCPLQTKVSNSVA